MSLIETILVSLRLRKTKKTQDPEKTQRSDSAGIINTPVEAKLASFEMKPQDIAPVPQTTAPYIGAEKTGLKLEDELPEEEPSKEERKENKASVKVPEEQVIKQKAEKVKSGKKGGRKKKPAKPEIKARTEIIPIPETEEVKPEKEGIKRKKPARKEAAETTPEKKTVKKKKSEKKPSKKKVEEN